MLDDAQLRTLEERLRYLRELEERRAAILESIRSQGKLDDALAGADHGRRLQGAAGGHLPAVQAEAAHQGADRPRGRPGAAGRRAARRPGASTRRPPRPAFVDADKGVADAAGGAGRRPGDPGRALRRGRRPDRRAARADVVAAAGSSPRCGTGKEDDGRQVRRLLRLRRAVHQAALAPDPGHVPRREGGDPRPRPWSPSRRSPTDAPVGRYERDDRRAGSASPTAGRPADKWLLDTVRWAWRTRILVHLGIDLRMRLLQAAEDEAVRVFAANLRDLLLAAPAGTRATMGLDPGFRTGVKVAVVDATGKVVATDTIYPHVPQPTSGTSRSPTLARAGQGARGRADRDRQRHRVPRDRQARRRPDQAGTRS